MERFLLFLKGMCVGIADVIPGVSGGTLALILGIYTELVNTIKGLHLRWLPSAWGWVRSGFSKEAGRALWAELEGMNVVFLAVLGSGIAVAIAGGGLVLPTLLERYPEAMRGLFFGLIVASVGVPFRMISFGGSRERLLVAVMVVVGVLLGWVLTAPEQVYEVSTAWEVVEAKEEDTLKSISRREPSALPAELVYWAPENEELRQAMVVAYPELELRPPGEGAAMDKASLKERSQVYEELTIPAGTPVRLPQPALWFIFVAAMIAICAMILPGISGSYLLLIMGAYYFVLNALKGVIMGLASLTIPPTALLYVVVFMAGAAIGILSFSRVLSFFLARHRAPTLGVLVGLMVGCLRGIWPFQEFEGGVLVNSIPSEVNEAVISAVVAGLVGVGVVVVLARVGQKYKEQSA